MLSWTPTRVGAAGRKTRTRLSATDGGVAAAAPAGVNTPSTTVRAASKTSNHRRLGSAMTEEVLTRAFCNPGPLPKGHLIGSQQEHLELYQVAQVSLVA